MTGWILERYGSPENLRLEEIPFPGFRDENELLLRVHAASVNPADRHMLDPPVIFRMGQGIRRPKFGRPGLDLAGRVEEVGKNVKDLHVGDEVFGVGRGAFGEYAVADASQLALKPGGVTFEQAAAVPIAATTALQGLRDRASVRPGQRVLINGASGGVGSFAIQIAKSLGAEVSAVCSSQNVALARSLGAERVFDYSREDFTRSGLRFDTIFDTQLNHSLAEYRNSLASDGILLLVGAGRGGVLRLLGQVLRTVLAARVAGPRTKFFTATVNTQDLATLAGLLESGNVAPVIDRRFPLSQVPEAFRYLIDGHARGKIVVSG
jgi:NADPH:quinone reductase-like Zn-dependent oxidoreductase